MHGIAVDFDCEQYTVATNVEYNIVSFSVLA